MESTFFSLRSVNLKMWESRMQHKGTRVAKEQILGQTKAVSECSCSVSLILFVSEVFKTSLIFCFFTFLPLSTTTSNFTILVRSTLLCPFLYHAKCTSLLCPKAWSQEMSVFPLVLSNVVFPNWLPAM